MKKNNFGSPLLGLTKRSVLLLFIAKEENLFAHCKDTPPLPRNALSLLLYLVPLEIPLASDIVTQQPNKNSQRPKGC